MIFRVCQLCAQVMSGKLNCRVQNPDIPQANFFRAPSRLEGQVWAGLGDNRNVYLGENFPDPLQEIENYRLNESPDA